MAISDLGVSFGLLLPLFLVITIFSFILFWRLLNKKDSPISRMGIMFLEIDLKNWRLRRKPISWNEKIGNHELELNDKNIFENGWIDLSTFFKNLSRSEQEKWKKSIEYCIQNKMNTVLETQLKLDKNQHNSLWYINFNYVNSNKINVYVKWINKNLEPKVKSKIVTKKEILDNKNPFKIFVAFGLVDDNKDTIQTFIKHFDNNLNIKGSAYFQSSNIVTLLISSKKYKKLQSTKGKILDSIKKIKNRSFIENYYDSVTFVEAKNVITENDFAKVMTRISFGLTKSKLTHEPFSFNLKSVFFNEFEEYKESIVWMNNLIKEQKLEIEKIKIKKISNEKQSFTYLVPKYEIHDSIWTNYVMKSSNFAQKIKDVFFEKTIDLVDSKVEHVMIDINYNDIEKIFHKLTSKNNLIYLLEINENFDVLKLISLLDLFKKYNINFGFKVKELNSNLLSVIENVKPKVIILNNDFNDQVIEDNAKTKLIKMGVIIMCERLQIIPIFENLSKTNKERIQTLGKKEKYYYIKPNIL